MESAFIPLIYGAFSLIFLHLKLHYLSPWQYFRQIKRNNSINCNSSLWSWFQEVSSVTDHPSITERGTTRNRPRPVSDDVHHFYVKGTSYLEFKRSGKEWTYMYILNNKWIQFSMKKVVIFLSLLLQFRNQYWSEKRENQPNNGITF